MAKWGDGYRYGSGTLWGQAGGGGVVSDPYSGEVVWIVNIDWYGTGGVNEANYTRDIVMSRGRKHYISPSGNGFEKMRSGKVTITMDNISGRFDAYNADSPLYGYLLPGRKIQISVYDVAAKETYVRFTGHVTDIQPSSGINQVTITAEGGIRWLTDAEYSTGVTYAKTTSEAADMVLSFVNWPYARNIQPSLQPLQVFEPGTGPAINVIQTLAEANLGAFFVDRFGSAVFLPVSYDVTTSHAIDQSQLLREIRFQQPWESVRNKIRVVANRKGKRPASIVWNMPGVERFDSGQTKVFGASFKNSDNITVENIVANSQLSGNGSDVSNYFTIAKSAVTATECTLTATNNSGAVAYLISLRLVGNALVSAPENMNDSDTTSIATFGPRSFVLDNQMLQDRSFAGAYATMLKNHLKDPHKDPIIQIQQRPSLQYPIDLYDKVVLTSAKLGIDAVTYTVGGIEERWLSETGQDVVTTFYLQTVLYDATVITPDPFVPGALPEMPIPDMPPWYEPYIPPLPDFELPDTTVTCLSGQYPTGPFYLTPTQTTLTTVPPVTEAIMTYPCTLRPAGTMFPSQLRLNIRTYEQVNGVWIPYVPNDIIKVTAFNAYNVDVATAVITGGGTAQTDRFATFYPTSALDVKGFRLKLDYSGVNGVPASDVTTTPAGLTVVHFGFDGPAATPLVNVGAWDALNTGGGNNFSVGTPISTSIAYWSEGRLNLKYPDGLGDYRLWRWVQPAGVCTAHTGATMTAIANAGSQNSSYIGISYTDSLNDLDETQIPTGSEVTRTATVAAGYNGRTVEQFHWNNQPFGTNTGYYLADVVLTGFTWSRTEKKITIGAVSVSHVCGAGLI